MAVVRCGSRPDLLPLAVSANLMATRTLDQDGLSEIIIDGAAVFETEYGLSLTDFLGVHPDLQFHFIDSGGTLDLRNASRREPRR